MEVVAALTLSSQVDVNDMVSTGNETNETCNQSCRKSYATDSDGYRLAETPRTAAWNGARLA